MKRFFCFALSLSLAFCLFGCGRKSKDLARPAQFYYCNKTITFDETSNVFSSEARETAEFQDLVSLMNHYLKGPVSGELVSPFPTQTEIVTIKEIGTTLDVTFSPQLSRLTGSELTLACVCTAMTLFELTEAETVIISAEGVRLDGKDSIMITPDRLSFADNHPPETVGG